MDGKTILIVDSDAASRNFIGTMLTKKQYNVSSAPSGKEGYIAALRDQPDVIIFDPYLADLPGVQFVRKIRADRRMAATILIALAAQPNSALTGELMAAGCNEFMVKSGEAVNQLFELIPLALQGGKQVSIRSGGKEGGLLIVFLSAKGGTGTSSLCANIAQNIAARQPELRVAVFDMVLPIGSIAPIVGYSDPTNLVSIAATPPEKIDVEYFRKNLPYMEKWNFHLLAGVPDPESANTLKAERIPEIVKTLKAAYDYVFVDMGRALSRLSLPIIQDADAVVVVAGADLSTVTLTKEVWTFLQVKGTDPRTVYMLLNRNVGLEGLSKSDAEKIIGFQIQATMPFMGTNFTLANNSHVPVLKRFPNETAAMMLAQISTQIADLARQARA
jgi:MinD-like ATPase involved in chromosome partitioning or flagellar assembly/ActR/RegA family two-component response regulator